MLVAPGSSQVAFFQAAAPFLGWCQIQAIPSPRRAYPAYPLECPKPLRVSARPHLRRKPDQRIWSKSGFHPGPTATVSLPHHQKQQDVWHWLAVLDHQKIGVHINATVMIKEPIPGQCGNTSYLNLPLFGIRIRLLGEEWFQAWSRGFWKFSSPSSRNCCFDS